MAKDKTSQPGTTDSTQAADVNRSKQLNSQDSAYHRSRGHSEAESQEQAGQTTQQNQERKK